MKHPSVACQHTGRPPLSGENNLQFYIYFYKTEKTPFVCMLFITSTYGISSTYYNYTRKNPTRSTSSHRQISPSLFHLHRKRHFRKHVAFWYPKWICLIYPPVLRNATWKCVLVYKSTRPLNLTHHKAHLHRHKNIFIDSSKGFVLTSAMNFSDILLHWWPTFLITVIVIMQVLILREIATARNLAKLNSRSISLTLRIIRFLARWNPTDRRS